MECSARELGDRRSSMAIEDCRHGYPLLVSSLIRHGRAGGLLRDIVRRLIGATAGGQVKVDRMRILHAYTTVSVQQSRLHTYSPSLHVRETNPELPRADDSRRVLLGHCWSLKSRDRRKRPYTSSRIFNRGASDRAAAELWSAYAPLPKWTMFITTNLVQTTFDPRKVSSGNNKIAYSEGANGGQSACQSKDIVIHSYHRSPMPSQPRAARTHHIVY